MNDRLGRIGSIGMRTLIALAVLMLIFSIDAEAQESCQYRSMELNDPSSGPTVIHIRITRGEEVRNFGYDEAGVYPWKVFYEWCGEGWLVEFRLGSACTRWTGEYMTRPKDSNGRAIPCAWSDWSVAEYGTDSPPGAPVLLAKLESMP